MNPSEKLKSAIDKMREMQTSIILVGQQKTFDMGVGRGPTEQDVQNACRMIIIDSIPTLVCDIPHG